jgi:hypothetical protein
VQKLGDAARQKRLGNAALVLIQGGRIVAEQGFGVAQADSSCGSFVICPASLPD